jgi:hypothetical protein
MISPLSISMASSTKILKVPSERCYFEGLEFGATETSPISPWRRHRLRGRNRADLCHRPLEGERFEPYVLPKRSLSGDTSERVDTRVLQAIYAFNPAGFPAFVGCKSTCSSRR